MIYKTIKRTIDNYKFGKINIILPNSYNKKKLRKIFFNKIYKINLLKIKKKNKKLFIISKL
ncbi:hypothetical protein ACWNYQ_00695 [Candidatus Vidania fulgoroideorum]